MRRKSRIPPPMLLPDGPVKENLFHRRAAVSLEVVVIGGGIEGLAAAYNLKQAGHKVRVFEKSDGRTTKIKGCSRSPPNMVKMLQLWGLEARLDSGVVASKIEFVDGATGKVVSSLVYHKELMKELGAEMYGLHYDDLCDMVRELTTMAGVRIEYKSEIVDVDVEAGTVKLANGSQISADLIVGADGPNGITRQSLVGHKELAEIGPFNTYSFIVSISKMRADPELGSLVEDSLWTLWLGDTYCVLAYPIREDEYLVTYNGPRIEGIHDNEPVPLSRLDIAQFEDRVHRLFALATTGAREELHYVQPPLEEWYAESGKVVLIGDSVHVPCPSSSNSHALAIEDTATLGCLFSRLGSRDSDEILRLLSAYQEIRQQRCETTIKSDADLVTFVTLPPSPERDARDEGFQDALAKADLLDWEDAGEGMLQEAFEEFRYSFGYDAYDAADEWWNDWGLMRARMNAAHCDEGEGLASGFVISTVTTDGEESVRAACR